MTSLCVIPGRWEVLGRRYYDQICQTICTWKWFNSFQAPSFDWQVPLFLLLNLCWLNPFNGDLLSFPSNPKTKVIVCTCFEVRFVSANDQTLIKIFSKATGSKRLNNVLQYCGLTIVICHLLETLFKPIPFSKFLASFPIIKKHIRKVRCEEILSWI